MAVYAWNEGSFSAQLRSLFRKQGIAGSVWCSLLILSFLGAYVWEVVGVSFELAQPYAQESGVVYCVEREIFCFPNKCTPIRECISAE